MKKYFLLLLLSIGGLSVLMSQIDDEEVVGTVDEPEDLVVVEKRRSEPAEPDADKISFTDAFDIEGKKRKAIAMVEKGVAQFKKSSLDEACHDFTQTKKFTQGELYLFVYDYTGVCLANGEDPSVLWKNRLDVRDTFGTYQVQEFIKTAKKGGGWVTYHWRGATKISYIKPVTKDDKSYLIGCGFYPHSKQDAVVSLVKGAVSLFGQAQKSGFARGEAFSLMSYPLGKFVYGDLYIYALDFKGTIYAQGEIPALIGTNSLEFKDARGKKPNKEIIEKLEKTDQGVWVEYISKNATKRTYAEKVTDSQGNNYFIACGYYPEANREAAEDLVKKGYAYMKRHGEDAARAEFTGPTKNDFRFGDLYLFVYDMKGNCIAHGGNETYVGQNHFNKLDQDGRPYIQEYIDEVKNKDNGWVDAKLNNSFQSAFVQKITLGLNSYVIGCGLYPISKQETMVLLAKSAASYLRGNSREATFSAIGAPNGVFTRGDLGVFVFDDKGTCYAYGDDPTMIWRNMLDAKDDDGRPWVKLLINKPKKGAGFVSYKLNGGEVVAYVEQVVKDGKTYVVGSSYYK